MGGRRVQKNFASKSEAKRVAKQILGGLTNDAQAVEAMATPELESMVAARKVLAPSYALNVAVEEHAQAVARLGKATLREAVDFFLRHHRTDVPRLPLSEISEQFAKSREQSGLSHHYVFLCRKFTRQLAEAFPGLCLSDLTTPALDKWIGGLKLGAITKNDMRRVLGTCGNWAEKQGHLLKGSSPFPPMVRYKEMNSDVSIFTPENIASLLKKADAALRPYLALGAFTGLWTAEFQRLDWSEIDLDRGFITVAASKANTRQRHLVPISDNLKLWLTPIRKTSGPVCLHVCPQHAARTLCEGFTWAKNGLRHSFISYRLAVRMTRHGLLWKRAIRRKRSSAIPGPIPEWPLLELIQAWAATRLWDVERTRARALRRLRAASERLSTAICPKKRRAQLGWPLRS